MNFSRRFAFVALTVSSSAFLFGQNALAQDEAGGIEKVEPTIVYIGGGNAHANDIEPTKDEGNASEHDAVLADQDKGNVSEHDAVLADQNETAQDKAEYENVEAEAEPAILPDGVGDAYVYDVEPTEEEEHVSDWQTVDVRKSQLHNTAAPARIAAEVAGGIIGAIPAAGAAMIISAIANNGGLYESDVPRPHQLTTLERACLIGAVITPFLESASVHLMGSMLGNQGKSWTPYAGGIAGGAIGAGLGALGFIDNVSTGSKTLFAGAAVGAIIGAVTWYELSNNHEKNKAMVTNIRPVIEISDQRTTMGVGFDF